MLIPIQIQTYLYIPKDTILKLYIGTKRLKNREHLMMMIMMMMMRTMIMMMKMMMMMMMMVLTTVHL